MANNALRIAPPPPRPVAVDSEAKTVALATPAKFDHVKEDERVQFNKRVTRRVADGFGLLAIRTRKSVPDLLAEALDLLEERHGKV